MEVKFQFSHYGKGTATGAWNLGAEEKFLVKEQSDSVTGPVITLNVGTESAVVMPKPSECSR